MFRSRGSESQGAAQECTDATFTPIRQYASRAPSRFYTRSGDTWHVQEAYSTVGWGANRWHALLLGCPRKNQIFFRFEPKRPNLNLFRLFFGLFRETKQFFFGLFQCFRPVSEQPKQTEKSQENKSLFGCPRNN